MPRKLRNGTYQAVWRVPGSNGEWRQKTKVFTQKSAAKHYETVKKMEVKQGLHLDVTKETVAEYLRRWIITAAPHLEPSSTRIYRWRIEHYIIPHLGPYKVAQLTPWLIEKCYADLGATITRRGEPMSPTTIRGVHLILNKAFNDGVQRGELLTNPLSRIPSSNIPRYPGSPGKSMTIAELQCLLTTTEGSSLHTMIFLSATLGMRLGEVVGLKWGHIDLDKQVIHLVEARKKTGYTGSLKGKEPRDIPITDAHLRELEAQRKRNVEKQDKAKEWVEQGLVFPGISGGYGAMSAVQRHWQRAIKAAGLPHYRFHDLRHTASTNLVGTGGDIISIAKILGHKDPHLTLKTYSHGINQERDLMEQVTKRLTTGE